MENLKITQGDYEVQRENGAVRGASGLPDNPSADDWNEDAIREQLDSLVKELIAVRINALIDALLSSQAGNSASETLGSAAIENVVDENSTPYLTVYGQLVNIASRLREYERGGIGDGVVTDAMLALGGVKTNFAGHIASLLPHIGNAGTSGGTASAYTASFSEGVAFSQDSVNFFVLTAHADNSINATLAIDGGTTRQIVTINNQNVAAGQMKQNGAYLFMFLPGTLARFILLNPAQYAHGHAIAEIGSLQTSLDGKAPSSHTHEQSAINGLVSALAGKAASSHGHAIADVSSLSSTISSLQSQINTKAASSDVSSTDNWLQQQINGKSSNGHGHAIGDVSGLWDQLGSKYPSSYIIYSGGTPGVVNGGIWLKPI